eukprot:scaffold192068_cov24-Attheya_sp.AAC.1
MAGFAVLGTWFHRRKVGYGYSGGGEGVFRPFRPGVGMRRTGERRVMGVGGCGRVVGGDSGLNLVGGPVA